MQLPEWLRQQNMTQMDFIAHARAHDVGFSYFAVAKWCNGQRIPRRTEMVNIFELTDGAVTPNDFYPLPKLIDQPIMGA